MLGLHFLAIMCGQEIAQCPPFQMLQTTCMVNIAGAGISVGLWPVSLYGEIQTKFGKGPLTGIQISGSPIRLANYGPPNIAGLTLSRGCLANSNEGQELQCEKFLEGSCFP